MNNQSQQPSLYSEIKAMLMLLLWAAHSSILPLRLFSRIPGTVGAGVWWPSLFLGWFLMLMLPTILFGMDESAVMPYWIAQVSFWLWLIHMFAYYRAHHQGRGAHTHHLGLSWLNKLRRDDSQQIAAAGDSFVAAGLAVLCLAFDCPRFAAWWLLNIVLTFGAAQIIIERDRARQRRVTSAAADQQYWKEMVQKAINEGEGME